MAVVGIGENVAAVFIQMVLASLFSHTGSTKIRRLRVSAEKGINMSIKYTDILLVYKRVGRRSMYRYSMLGWRESILT